MNNRDCEKLTKKVLKLCPFKIGDTVETNKQYNKYETLNGKIERIHIISANPPFEAKLKTKLGRKLINIGWLKLKKNGN